MSKNKSLSMKTLSPNEQSKKLISDLSNSNIKQEKLLKLRFHGKKILVPYEEYLSLKKLNREKMKAFRDALIQIIKTKKEIYIQQNTYDFDSLKKISVERENEFRNIIFNLQNDIRKERNIYSKDIYNFYNYVIKLVKNIYESSNNEIIERIKAINKLININITNCEFKQNKLLDKQIKKNEEYFDYMNSSTYQMKNVIDNYYIINNKIFEFQEMNYNYKKNILKEEIKNEYIKQLMKNIKIKINKTQKLIFEFNNNNINSKTILNESYNKKKNKNFISRQNRDKYLTENKIKKYFSSQKIIKQNNSLNKKDSLLLTIDITNSNSKIRRRPFSSGQRLKTFDKNSNSTKRTNYSNSNTLQSNFRVNSSKGRPINFKANSYKNLFDIKNKIFKSNISSKYIKTNQNSYFFSSETEENKNYTKSEWNTILFIKKEIKNLKNKQNEILNKLNDNIPDNDIYNSLANIIQKLRKDKDNIIVDGINNKYMKGYMKAIPIQNKTFRKKFLEILFNDNKIYESIKKATKENNNKLFNINIFGAVKINKDLK